MDNNDLNPNNLIVFAMKMMTDPQLMKNYIELLKDTKIKLEKMIEEKKKEQENKKEDNNNN
jgi:hypothetical protein